MTLAAEDIRALETATAGGTALRWGVSALAVATAYAAVLWVALALPPPEGVEGELQEAVMIELEPLTALEEAPPPAPEPEVEEAAAEPAPAPPEPQVEPSPEPPEPAVAPEPVAEPPPPPPEPVAEPPPPEPVAEPPPPEPVVEEPPPEPEPPKPEPVAEPEPLPEPLPEPTPEPPPQPLPEPTTEEIVPDLTQTNAIAAAVLNPPVPTLRPPPPRPRVEAAERPRPERRKPVEKPRRPAERVAKAEPRKPVAPPRAETRRSAAPRSDSSASSRSSQAPRVSSASWQRLAVSHFRKFRRRMETRERGTARVAVTIDRGGRVVGARLASSSGSAALDGEALALVRRASPIPAPPEGVGGRTLQLTVPVSM